MYIGSIVDHSNASIIMYTDTHVHFIKSRTLDQVMNTDTHVHT